MNIIAADLISKILKANPEERISLRDILNHPFFTQYFTNPTSCLIKPDNTEYKVFINPSNKEDRNSILSS